MRNFRLSNKTDGLLVFSDYKQKRYQLLYIALLLLLAIGVLIVIFPIFWLFITSLKTANEVYLLPGDYHFFPTSFDLAKYVIAFSHVSKEFLNSIIVVIGASLCSVFFNGLLGYGLSVLKPKGHKVLFILIMGCMLIPATTAMVPLYKNINTVLSLFKGFFNGIGFEMPSFINFLPLWLIAGANPFNVLLFKTFFDRIPSVLYEAAQIDGAGKLTVFFKIVLPLSKPIIMVVIIFTINATWSDFLLPYLVLDSNFQTVMIKVNSINTNPTLYGVTTDQLLAILLTSMLPPIILFLIFQRQITSSVATAGIKE